MPRYFIAKNACLDAVNFQIGTHISKHANTTEWMPKKCRNYIVKNVTLHAVNYPVGINTYYLTIIYKEPKNATPHLLAKNVIKNINLEIVYGIMKPNVKLIWLTV